MQLNEVLSPNQIADKLIKTFDLSNDNQLADYLGVERQQIRQYRNGRGGNISCRMLTALLSSRAKTPNTE